MPRKRFETEDEAFEHTNTLEVAAEVYYEAEPDGSGAWYVEES